MVADTIVFSDPSKSADKITEVKKGDKILSRKNLKQGDWLSVILPNNKLGWILAERFRFLK
jgi:hypothetical protein